MRESLQEGKKAKNGRRRSTGELVQETKNGRGG
jgi:hypothetical protein